MSLYKLIEYSDDFLKTSGGLLKYYRDEQAIGNNGNIIDFSANNNNSALFKFKQKITWQTGNGGTKDVEIIVPLKYLSNFWRTLEMPLIDCETSFQLKWSRNYILVASTAANQNPRFHLEMILAEKVKGNTIFQL